MSYVDVIRRYIADNFADGGAYTSNDVASLAQTKGGLDINVQQAGDALRGWADRNMIVNGYQLERVREVGRRDRFRLHAFGSSTEEVERPKPPIEVQADAMASVKPKSERFAGKVVDQRSDGSFLVSGNDNRLYVVSPLKW